MSRKSLKVNEEELVSSKKSILELNMKVSHLEKKNKMLEKINALHVADLEDADSNNDQLLDLVKGLQFEIESLKA